MLSALGMLLADVTKDYSLTILKRDAMHLARRDRRPVSGRSSRRRRAIWSGKASAGDRAAIERVARRSLRRPVLRDHACRSRPDIAPSSIAQHARRYGYSNPSGRPRLSTCACAQPGVTAKPVLPRVPVSTRSSRRRAGTRDRLVRRTHGPDRHLPVGRPRCPAAPADGPAVIAGARSDGRHPARIPASDRRLRQRDCRTEGRSGLEPQAPGRSTRRAAPS